MSPATVSRARRPGVQQRAADCAGRLDALGSDKRLKEFRAGNLSRSELFAWAARYPEEVPMDGELPWIAMQLADLD